MVRQARSKYVHCNRERALSFDVTTDPRELADLAPDPAHAVTPARFRGLAKRRWSMDRLIEDILLSQRRRNVIQPRTGGACYRAWDFQPFEDATRPCYRGGSGNWHAAEERDVLRFT